MHVKREDTSPRYHSFPEKARDGQMSEGVVVQALSDVAQVHDQETSGHAQRMVRLAEATDAYQRMIDLRPDLHSYARGAHIRWLKGDLTGAVELMELAVSASSPLV